MKYIIQFLILAIGLLCLEGCVYEERIRDGKTAYERKHYALATNMLENEFEKAKTQLQKAEIAYKIADSYDHLNKNSKALDWYKQAYDLQYGSDALKGYAYALKKKQSYKKAIQAFTDLGVEIGSPYEYRREITACKQARGWLKLKKKRAIKIEKAKFSSKSFDYAPVLYEDRKLIFTSDRSSSTGEEKYKWTNKDFSDLFVVDLEKGSKADLFSEFNTPYNEGTITFDKAYETAMFTRCGAEGEGTKTDEGDNVDFCKIMVSRRKGEGWSKAKAIEFEEEALLPLGNYAHPTLSDDGKYLIFAINDPEGWGGYDLYSSNLKNGKWSEPKNLGRGINSRGNEKFPNLDGDTLYFSSDFHVGMGGLDIFKSVKMSANRWGPLQNLRAPINSGADDFGYIVDRKAPKKDSVISVGYFTSSRTGIDNIYKFTQNIPPPKPPKPPKDTTIKPEPIVYKMILEGVVLEKIYADKENPNSRILGRKPLGGATVQVNFNGKKETLNIGADGSFTMELEEETAYNFFATKEGYLSNDERFSTKGIGKSEDQPIQKFQIEIVLDKIFKNKEIVLENIYYDLAKWDIRRDAEPTLNNLAKLLLQNPSINIELSSHTDCRGSDSYNKTLSQKRAQSAVDYLIKKGINSSRLIAKGYGEDLPSALCSCTKCSEVEHQQNRRTAFKILE